MFLSLFWVIWFLKIAKNTVVYGEGGGGDVKHEPRDVIFEPRYSSRVRLSISKNLI